MILGRRTTPVDLTHARPGAKRLPAPVKALCRFLVNFHLRKQLAEFPQASDAGRPVASDRNFQRLAAPGEEWKLAPAQ